MNEPSAPNQFRHEGDYWTIAFDGRVCRLRDSKGLRYLAQLLAQPRTHFDAADLVARAGNAPHPPEVRRVAQTTSSSSDEPARRERARVTVSKGLKAALQRIEASLPALGQHLEVTIRRGYRCSYNPDPRADTVWEL